MTADGYRLEYDWETITETTIIETAKVFINSTILTKGSHFACLDVENF